MITSTELQYVNLWASKIPMPGYEYSMEVFKCIEKCYDIFNSKYKDKSFSFIFSNSEEIFFEINKKNLCHMLGIDFDNIRSQYFNDYRKRVFNDTDGNFNSFELLELILENKEKIAELDNDSKCCEKVINYYKSAVKCIIFSKLSDFEKFNFAAINYIGDKTNIDYSKEKLLFLPSNEALTPYFIINIVLDDLNEEKYVVKSSFAPKDPKIYFDNQEVIIPTQILYTDNYDLRKLVATPEEKMHLLTMYSDIVNKYNITSNINVLGDYASVLNEQTNAKTLTLR